jgi:transcriptional regulator with XRE-family HTH domain
MPKRKSTLTPEALAVRWLGAYAGWSRRELAVQSELAETTLYRYENGATVPGLAVLEHLAATVAFPCPVAELLAWCRKSSKSGDADATAPPVAWASTDPLRATGEAVLRAVLPAPSEPAPPSSADRAAVPELWARLSREKERDRPRLLEQTPALWHWALCEHLCR